MKRLLVAALAALSVAGTAASAIARDLDASRVGCSEMSDPQKSILLLYWLDGYLSGRTGETFYSDEWIQTVARTVEAECFKNPSQSVLEILNRQK